MSYGRKKHGSYLLWRFLKILYPCDVTAYSDYLRTTLYQLGLDLYVALGVFLAEDFVDWELIRSTKLVLLHIKIKVSLVIFY